jgi:galactose mutarotase-like enzyme
MPEHRISSSLLSATISSLGAELTSLETAAGQPLLWHGDATWWGGRSPLLFPLVGRVPEDRILVDGRSYPMKQHGFARTSQFVLTAAEAHTCTFELTDTDATRAVYPFAFALRATYSLAGATLAIRVEVCNREAQRALPFSFGFHPAFLWPLLPGSTRDDYALAFETPEPAAIGRPVDGLLSRGREPSPVGADGLLPLRDALFEGGALIWDSLASRVVTYRCGNRDVLRVAFPNLPHLGVWTKPGAPFVCIEPWQGYAAPEGFQGELRSKPGTLLLAPGKSHFFNMDLTLVSF